MGVVFWAFGGLLAVGGEEGESLDDKHFWERPSGRESQGRGSKLVYRLLLLTADPGLSGDVDSLAGLGGENLVVMVDG